MVVGDDPVELLEDPHLERFVLHDGLDDELPVGELVDVGGERQVGQRGVTLGFGELVATRRRGRATW